MKTAAVYDISTGRSRILMEGYHDRVPMPERLYTLARSMR